VADYGPYGEHGEWVSLSRRNGAGARRLNRRQLREEFAVEPYRFRSFQTDRLAAVELCQRRSEKRGEFLAMRRDRAAQFGVFVPE
jgi:hypothetical protein